MAVHVPVHPRHVPRVRVSRDVLSAAIAVLVLAMLVVAAVLIPPYLARDNRASDEGPSLIEFRAGERAAGISEAESLIDFRAGERAIP